MKHNEMTFGGALCCHEACRGFLCCPCMKVPSVPSQLMLNLMYTEQP